jgi:hypothetical protein
MAVLTAEQAAELCADMREAFELVTSEKTRVDRTRWTDPVIAVAFFHEIRKIRARKPEAAS